MSSDLLESTAGFTDDLGPQPFDAHGYALIATDQAGRIVLWNEVAENLYGLPAQQTVGRHLTDVRIDGTRRRRPRPPASPPDSHALAEIRDMHASGASAHTIAAALNAQGLRAPRGQRWRAATVAQALELMR